MGRRPKRENLQLTARKWSRPLAEAVWRARDGSSAEFAPGMNSHRIGGGCRPVRERKRLRCHRLCASFIRRIASEADEVWKERRNGL